MASIAEALQAALAHHRDGALAAAEVLYRRILAADPAQADALNLLARLCLETGRPGEAAILSTRAATAAPAALAYRLTQADAAAATADATGLANALRAATALAPDRADLWHRLGLALATLVPGDAPPPEESLLALERAEALAPGDPAPLNDHAVLALRTGRAADAQALLERAVALGDAQARANLGPLLRHRATLALERRDPEAITQAECLARRAIALSVPAGGGGTDDTDDQAGEDGQAWGLLGQALSAAQRLDEAAVAFATARTRGYGGPDAAVTQGDCLTRLGRLDEADQVLRPALDHAPDHPGLLNNTGILRHTQGRLDEAAALFHRAITAAPDDPRPRVNLGTLLKDQGDDIGADAQFRAALALAPDDPAIHWQHALARLMAGDFATGWREYEWRWRTGRLARSPALADLPEWTGETPAGRRILVECEQGHGDSLQFIRYIPALRALCAQGAGGAVGVAAQPALVRLFQASLPDVTVLPLGRHPGKEAPPWEARVALMSLPLRLAPWLGTDPLPAPSPYLTPPADPTERWARRWATLPAGPKVGLVWAGDPRPDDPASALIDRRRSLEPAALAPLAALPGLVWVSVQKGRTPPADFPLPLVDWTSELGDFADTAALVSRLDLVVTVDTAVAHLAGGLGRPVWLLSRFDGCWRWGRPGNDHWWYPHLRVFRQNRWGDWQPTLETLAREMAIFRQSQASRRI